ncbi:MAG: DUF2390 domain-containing protein [Oceanobacter sp.]
MSEDELQGVKNRSGGANPLWQFAKGYYGHRENTKHLLNLQEEEGADVLLLLTALWLLYAGCELDDTSLPLQLNDYQTIRDDMIEPLRSVRKKLGSINKDELYQDAKELEIGLEKRGFEVIYQSIDRSGILLKRPVDKDFGLDNFRSAYINLALKTGRAFRESSENPSWSYLLNTLKSFSV